MKNRLTIEDPNDEPSQSLFPHDAKEFLAELCATFAPRVRDLLTQREKRQLEINAGRRPAFAADTEDVRVAKWQIGGIPEGLRGPRVEVIGPPERQAIGNAFAAGASGFVVDLDDGFSPTWKGRKIEQLTLRGLIDDNRDNRPLANSSKPIWLRPRGLHRVEENVLLNGDSIPAALFDVGVFTFHNAAALKSCGECCCLSLPKLESHLEAEMWRDVFNFIERAGVVDRGDIKTTVLIETIPAAFEMHEILYELREFVVGLACDRTDYAFSYAKCFHNFPESVLPDQTDIAMGAHFIESQNRLLVRTCHRRGALAIGDVSRYVLTDDDDLNEFVDTRTRNEKERELALGFDVSTVRQTELVAPAAKVFGPSARQTMSGTRSSGDTAISTGDLLQECRGKITDTGVRQCINDTLRVAAARLAGQSEVRVGCRRLHHSTAELSRAQLWQWVHHATGILDEGTNVDYEFFQTLLNEETDRINADSGCHDHVKKRLPAAATLLDHYVRSENFLPFLEISSADQ